jgi:hypothetical protein
VGGTRPPIRRVSLGQLVEPPEERVALGSDEQLEGASDQVPLRTVQELDGSVVRVGHHSLALDDHAGNR